MAFDRGLLDHVGEIHLVHLGHAAARMARLQIALEQFELLLRRPWLACRDDQVAVAANEFALCRVGRKLSCHHANRHAGGAIGAAGPVGDILAAAKADAAECVIKFRRIVAVKFGKDLPLAPARNIGARAGVRHKEARKTKWCAHPTVSVKTLRET